MDKTMTLLDIRNKLKMIGLDGFVEEIERVIPLDEMKYVKIERPQRTIQAEEEILRPIIPEEANKQYRILREKEKSRGRKTALKVFNKGLAKGIRVFLVNDPKGVYGKDIILEKDELDEIVQEYEKYWTVNIEDRINDWYPISDGWLPQYLVCFREKESREQNSDENHSM